MQLAMVAFTRSNGGPSPTRTRNPQSGSLLTRGTRRIATRRSRRRESADPTTLRESAASRQRLLGAFSPQLEPLARFSPGDGNSPPQDVLPGITAIERHVFRRKPALRFVARAGQRGRPVEVTPSPVRRFAPSLPPRPWESVCSLDSASINTPLRYPTPNPPRTS
jgi:hypothetical protein